MKFINKLYFSLLISCPAISNEIPVNMFFTEFNQKIANLAEQEKICSNKARVLNKDTFQNIKITPKEIQVILEYKDLNAFISCSNEKRLEYYKASVLLRLSSNVYADTLDSSDELISTHEFWLLKAKKEYETIAPEIRKKLDAIKELDKPFNLITSYEVLSKQ